MTKFTRADVTVLNKEAGYDGFFKVNRYTLEHRLFQGGMTKTLLRECFERGHAVGVLAYDPWQDKVILLEQFRIGAYCNGETGQLHSPWLYEIIAGIVEPGESQQEVAYREAQEEAGCQLLALEPICDFYVSPGGTSETIQLYCGCVKSDGMGGIFGLDDEGEDIRVIVLEYLQAVDLMHQGKLNNASTLIAMQWLMLNREMLHKKWMTADAKCS
jgi:ADP-ribose pyrophosphatase